MSIYEAPSHEGRKRYKFRGTKIFTEMFSKKKKNNIGGKKDLRGLHFSRSADMTASMSASMSRSWGDDPSHYHSHAPIGYLPHYHHSQQHPGHQSGYYYHQQPVPYAPQSHLLQQGSPMRYYYPAAQGGIPVQHQPHQVPYGPQQMPYNKQPVSLHQSPVRAVIQ